MLLDNKMDLHRFREVSTNLLKSVHNIHISRWQHQKDPLLHLSTKLHFTKYQLQKTLGSWTGCWTVPSSSWGGRRTQSRRSVGSRHCGLCPCPGYWAIFWGEGGGHCLLSWGEGTGRDRRECLSRLSLRREVFDANRNFTENELLLILNIFINHFFKMKVSDIFMICK